MTKKRPIISWLVAFSPTFGSNKTILKQIECAIEDDQIMELMMFVLSRNDSICTRSMQQALIPYPEYLKKFNILAVLK